MATRFGIEHGPLQIVLGDRVNFLIHEQNGTHVPDEYNIFRIPPGSATPTKVHNGTMGAVTLTLDDGTPTGGTATADNWYAPTDSGYSITTSDSWDYGDVGLIVAYDEDGGTDAHCQYFQVVRGAGIEYLKDTEPTDSTAEANPNNLLGRLWTVEKNQRDVLMPRLKRALGLLGEHQVVDAFLYDDDGNITECRLRFFETKANATAAAKWTDRVNEADPRTTPVTGEIAVYTITASNLLPRNLRTLYEQKIDADETDNLFGTGTSEGSTGSTI